MYDAKQADMWSAGVVLYVMLYGGVPFEVGNDRNIPEVKQLDQLLQQMDAEDYELNPSVFASLECLDLVKRLLKPVTADRIKRDEVLLHPWFQKKLPPPIVRDETGPAPARAPAPDRRAPAPDWPPEISDGAPDHRPPITRWPPIRWPPICMQEPPGHATPSP
eukprot:gene4682-14883_t